MAGFIFVDRKHKVIYIKNVNNIPNQIKKIVKNDDMIICMGAGNINKISNEIYKEISA